MGWDLPQRHYRRRNREDIKRRSTCGKKAVQIKLIESFEEISRTITYRWAFIRPWFRWRDHRPNDGVYNGVSLTGTVVGTVVLTGRGAGQDPTAGSVISDIVDAVKGMKGMISQPKLLHVTPDECTAATASEICGCFYLRLRVDDRPGQLAKIAECLAESEVSLATVSQTPKDEDASAQIILTTHETNEHSIQMAIEALEQLPGVKELRPLQNVRPEWI